MYLTATPYSKDMDINGYGYGPDVDYPEGNHIGVHIAHGMLLDHRPPFDRYSDLYKVDTTADIILTGHDHLNKHVPTINTPVVTDEQLINTISQLDAAVTDILEAGRKNEETYQNKAALARRARQLETSIQITESEAINTICGTGKDAYGIIPYPDGKQVKVAVTNDTQRDAFRRHFSATERKELASVEADIKAIEVSQFKTREDLDAKKEALSCIRAKAQLQAAALTYLA